MMGVRDLQATEGEHSDEEPMDDPGSQGNLCFMFWTIYFGKTS